MARIALTTYSVKPRGGVVHTLELAEALHAKGVDVTVIAMGDPDAGFFRPVDAPVHIVPAPAWGSTLEERVFSWIEAMTRGIDELRNEFDIVHSQDCISARAAAHVRDAGAPFKLLRTVHHVDDFTTQALIDCQRNAILEPDAVLVVSELWRRQLAADYGVDSTVVTNGVRADRFSTGISDSRRVELRGQIGGGDRFIYLTVGGIEPRKGSEYLIDALSRCKAARPPGRSPILAVIGGHSFQDYEAYRTSVLGSLGERGLVLGEDVVLLGTVSDDELPEWFHAADGFVFPSVNEGWGLVVLEAMSAGLPVVASDIEVFHEFLVHGENALMTQTANPVSLAAGMARLVNDPELAAALAAAGPRTAARYPWSQTADQHLAAYARFS
jgi:glycosyltransferase-like protein